MLSRINKTQNVYEKQSKFITDRITLVEKHFAELCSSFAAFSRKAARLRDKGDEMAKVLQTYADSEIVNKSLSAGLSNFSKSMSFLCDYRDAEVQRIDNKVVAELSRYDVVCKRAKEELKHSISTRDKEITRKRHLDRVKERNPRNRQQISLAESELSKASVEVSRTIKSLEKQTDLFEKQMLSDIKTVLLDFVKIELAMHTKAVELLTAAYQDISNVDIQSDFEEFSHNMQGHNFHGGMSSSQPTGLQSKAAVQGSPMAQYRGRSLSMGTLFTTPTTRRGASQEREDSKGRLDKGGDSLQWGLAQSMDSINSERYVKIQERQHKKYKGYDAEPGCDTDEESFVQIRPFFKNP